MCLTINIASIAQILKKVDSDVLVDHLALMDITKSKAEPVTIRRKMCLEILSPFPFNLNKR